MSTHSIYAVPLVFAAGAASSLGPCVAPRFIAVAGIAAGKSRSQIIILTLSFIAGLVFTYAAFGAVSSLLLRATQVSGYTYALVAAALAAGGVWTLWREETRCAHLDYASKHGTGAGAAFLLGCSFALVVSPCCTPLVLGIVAYTSESGNAVYASELLCCFALGHALPVIAVAFGVQRVNALLERYAVRQAASVVSATLMLGLAGYYAVLA